MAPKLSLKYFPLAVGSMWSHKCFFVSQYAVLGITRVDEHDRSFAR